MAYDRYDTRETPRDERSRWRDERFEARDRGRREDRGFFERAGDEVASWFGDEEAERRRREDQLREERERGFAGHDRGFVSSDRDFSRERGRRDWYDTRGLGERGGWSERDHNPSFRRDFSGSRDRDEDRFRERGRDYRPLTGDYGRSEQFFAASGVGRADRDFSDFERSGYDRSQTPYGRDEYRRSTYAGSPNLEREHDPHYRSWRDRHLSELDRDYEDYRRENQSRFESDFGNWRERKMQKRALLGQIREHMEIVGNDDQHVGTIDRVAGDRIILTKSDPESGGVHHSLSCSDIDRVEGDRVILDCSAGQARQRWRDESRSRALFEREDQGEMGPRMLDRSFEGTYR
jgi:hypothetical protein